jgi:hypothetical protein
MTTPQIYGLFAMLTAAAIAGLIFYCIGLRTGRQASTNIIEALEESRTNLDTFLAGATAELIEVKRTLDAREGALSKLRQSLIEEQRDHGEVERGLLNRLASVCRLTAEDHAVLVAMAAKLGLAADTFAGFNAHDHAKSSRLFQALALDLADRIHKALANQQPHPDSELIDFLEEEATVDFDLEACTLRFYAAAGTEIGITSVRDLLRNASADSQAMTQNHAAALQAAQADAA